MKKINFSNYTFCLHFSKWNMHSQCDSPVLFPQIENNLFSNVCGVCVHEIFLLQRTTLMFYVEELENALMYQRKSERFFWRRELCKRGMYFYDKLISVEVTHIFSFLILMQFWWSFACQNHFLHSLNVVATFFGFLFIENPFYELLISTWPMFVI